MRSYYVQNRNPTNSPSGSFSSSSSIASTSFHNNKDAKTKTSNKAARLSTDPQSIAARHRRHRISDRFKTLQSLVPGGSKLDTVSMLDEAIQYVKFLKTQILLHQSLHLAISGSDAPAPDQKSGAGVVNDQAALSGFGNHDGGSGVDFGDNDDVFAQMQLSELPEAYFHFQGQECNFSNATQYFEY